MALHNLSCQGRAEVARGILKGQTPMKAVPESGNKACRWRTNSPAACQRSKLLGAAHLGRLIKFSGTRKVRTVLEHSATPCYILLQTGCPAG